MQKMSSYKAMTEPRAQRGLLPSFAYATQYTVSLCPLRG